MDRHAANAARDDGGAVIARGACVGVVFLSL